LERARAQGAMTVGITNEEASTLARIADYAFLVRAGKEKSVAATKTYTGQLLSLYLLAHALGGAIRIDDLQRLPDWTAAALKLEDRVAEGAQRYRFMEHALVVGRGLNYSNAFELALKLMETCYVVAERFSSADLLHGPIAMLEASFPVFLFAPPGVTWQGLRQLIGRLSEIRTEIVIVTDLSNERAVKQVAAEGLARRVVVPVNLSYKPGPADLFTPIPYIVPAQLFAAYLAHVKGLDPDRPRALKKVTQTM
jgi:glucosamine--fructose-6-phosphate aminotransferase (isomerizing)